MRRIVRQVITYQCGICKTQYSNKRRARACEKIPIQKPLFKVGDTVWSTYIRACCGWYYPKMKVIRVFGSMLSEHSELGGHLFIYATRYRCPRCGGKHENDFWPSDICGAPRPACLKELKKLRKVV